jgi:hypothetical protein
MDINMGGMSGFELCREFRLRHGGGSDLIPYIIIVTANEGVDVINQALDCGANDYMPKPVNVKVLQVRLRVAERLLSQAQAGGGANANVNAEPAAAPVAAPVPLPIADGVAPGEAARLSPRHLMIADSIENAEVPVAFVAADGADSDFKILYSNAAMTLTTQFSPEQLVGKSLSDLEAWTPEFMKMILEYVSRGAILSHVPMWSRTRQEFQVYLSFYPVRVGDNPVTQYIVIHHL